MTQNHITIVAFSGPSGSGKSELAARLQKGWPENLLKWPQSTTRKRRGPGDDYVFVTKAQYQHMKGAMTCRTEFNGNFYGTIPEPTPGGTAVLTIVDANGVRDLEKDTREHNEALARGDFGGKFGDQPVRLIKVFMIYDRDCANFAERTGGRDRTPEFIKAEADAFIGISFEEVLDTTKAWPDEEKFFNDVIWPAITQPFASSVDWGERVHDLCNDLAAHAMALSGGDWPEGEAIAAYLQSVLDDASPPRTQAKAPAADGIDDALASPVIRPQSVLEYEVVDQVTNETRAKIDELVQQGSVAPQLQHVTLEVVLNASSQPEAEVLTELTGDGSGEALPPVSNEERTAEAAVVPPIPADEPAIVANEPEEPVIPLVAPRATAVIYATDSLTDWLMDEAIGEEAMANDNTFLLMFQQFISSHGGDPSGMSVSSQESKDGKGGIVRGFLVRMPNSPMYIVEFNERIKQIVTSKAA
jgi:hypothetical protein